MKTLEEVNRIHNCAIISGMIYLLSICKKLELEYPKMQIIELIDLLATDIECKIPEFIPLDSEAYFKALKSALRPQRKGTSI